MSLEQVSTGYTLRRGRWQYGVVAAGALVVVACALIYWARVGGETTWWRLLFGIAAAVVFTLFGVTNAAAWLRYDRVPPPVYADERVLRLALPGTDEAVELSWTSVREVRVARRPFGIAVSVLPMDPATHAPSAPAWMAAFLPSLGRADGRLAVTVTPVSATVDGVAAVLASLSSGRCPIRVA